MPDKDESGRRIEAIGINDPNAAIWECPDCYALIMLDKQAEHEQWHEKLRRAVDEKEMLG